MWLGVALGLLADGQNVGIGLLVAIIPTLWMLSVCKSLCGGGGFSGVTAKDSINEGLVGGG